MSPRGDSAGKITISEESLTVGAESGTRDLPLGPMTKTSGQMAGNPEIKQDRNGFCNIAAR